MGSIQGKSFIATLQVATPGFEAPVCCRPSNGTIHGGWLVPGRQDQTPVQMHFDYVEQVEGRDHFTISAVSGEYAGGKLGVSRNGYLGFYSVAQVTDIWKLEWVAESDSGRFIWRDHRGYRVAVAPYADIVRVNDYRSAGAYDVQVEEYFCVENGEVREFQTHILRVVD